MIADGYDEPVEYGPPLKPYFTRYGDNGQKWGVSWHEDELDAADLYGDDTLAEDVEQLLQVSEIQLYSDDERFMIVSGELDIAFAPNAGSRVA